MSQLPSVQLATLWFGTLTENTSNSGTNSPIVLIVNQNGTDRLHHTFSSTFQQGRANLNELAVLANKIEPLELDDSSIRVGIRGEDLWRPEHIIVWGQLNTGVISPLAIETSLGNLSTNASEGNLSVPLRRVGLGNDSMVIRRLLVLMTTSNVQNAGTNDTVRLLMNTKSAGFIADISFPNEPQDAHQQQGQANWYFAPPLGPVGQFTKNDLGDDSIRLRIMGPDPWLPASFFVFGLDDTEGRPEFLVPLVHIRPWSHGWMSTNSSLGVSIVTLQKV